MRPTSHINEHFSPIQFVCSKTFSSSKRKCIPDYILRIDLAKMFYYQFSSPMFNKSLPETYKNMRLAINLFGIVKEINGDKVVFYEGCDPQKRGEKIMKEFFVKKL